jgi:hypothetical protein
MCKKYQRLDGVPLKVRADKIKKDLGSWFFRNQDMTIWRRPEMKNEIVKTEISMCHFNWPQG